MNVHSRCCKLGGTYIHQIFKPASGPPFSARERLSWAGIDLVIHLFDTFQKVLNVFQQPGLSKK